MKKPSPRPRAGVCTASTFAALGAGALICMGLALAAGAGPVDLLRTIWSGSWGNAEAAINTQAKMTPLLFTGLAVALAYSAGLLNIGCEGQLTVGALVSASFAAGAAPLPGFLLLPLTLAAGAVSGGLWALPAVLLRQRHGVHEVISTLLLNYIAIYICSYLVSGPLGDGTAIGRTALIPSGAKMPEILRSGPLFLTSAPLIALAFCFAAWLWLSKTVWGFEARAVGSNFDAAVNAGILASRRQVTIFAASGALAGLAGAFEVCAVHHRFYRSFSPGYGFDGLTASFLANGSPEWLWLSTLFLASLRSSDKLLQIGLNLSPNFILVVQAVLLLSVACRDGIGRLLEKTASRLLLPLLLLLFACLSLFACERRQQAADMVITNGAIATADQNHPEAEAIAVRGDSIVAVGSNNDVRPYIGQATKVLDIRGMFAMPGFIEGHGHLIMLGRSKMELDLTNACNWDEIGSMVRDRAQKSMPGEWIVGLGWHQEKWDKVPSPSIEGYPTDESLNAVSPENPVLLTHASGHALFANARARELAGVTNATPDPQGGRILRDSLGNPTGVFFDSAQNLIAKAHDESLARRTPEQTEAQSREAIRLAVQDCLSKGVTSFQDAASSFQEIDLYKRLVDENNLGIRLWAMVHEDNAALSKNLFRYRIIDYGNKRLTVRAVKKFMDGALGSHTAWMLEPYSDLPERTGLNVESTNDILEAARLAIKSDFQMCVHAIGDRANREALDIYEVVFHENPGRKGLRWRIEHAQHLNPADIPRFALLGVIASMQAVHCTSDGPWVVKRIGAKRAEEGAYVWQKLMRTGTLVMNGTDTPVEDVNPIPNFYAAVTRKLTDGQAFYPDQRMSREEALRACTINSAYGAFEEDIKGSLKPGKLADITVLSKEIMKVPEDEILNTQVVYTIVGGRIMYEKR